MKNPVGNTPFADAWSPSSTQERTFLPSNENPTSQRIDVKYNYGDTQNVYTRFNLAYVEKSFIPYLAQEWYRSSSCTWNWNTKNPPFQYTGAYPRYKRIAARPDKIDRPLAIDSSFSFVQKDSIYSQYDNTLNPTINSPELSIIDSRESFPCLITESTTNSSIFTKSMDKANNKVPPTLVEKSELSIVKASPKAPKDFIIESFKKKTALKKKKGKLPKLVVSQAQTVVSYPPIWPKEAWDNLKWHLKKHLDVTPSAKGCARIDGYFSHLKHKIWRSETKGSLPGQNIQTIDRTFQLIRGEDQQNTNEDFLFVSRSNIHTWGLYTQIPIEKNSLIIYYKGEIVSNRVAFLRELSYIKKGIGSSYLFRCDDNYVIDATKRGNIARFMNHSCEPNAYAVVLNEKTAEMKIAIYAKRNIEIWEEITYDYKFPIEEFDKIVYVGAKCICDYCHSDISNSIYINCAQCPNIDLCILCFSRGVIPSHSGDISKNEDSHSCHQPDHPYYVKEPLDFPILDRSWRADEEIYLLESLDKVGLGNWCDASFYLGSKTAEECEAHYYKFYLSSANLIPTSKDIIAGFVKLPLYKAAHFADGDKPTALASVPSDHEVVGFMSKREEFETEFENDAEHLVKDLIFLDTDTEFERELKFAILYTYCDSLEKRLERKRTIFEHNLIEYKKITQAEKEKSKEERDIYHTLIPFARFMSNRDFSVFTMDFLDEYRLKKYINALQNYRKKGYRTIAQAIASDRHVEEPNSGIEKNTPNISTQGRRGMGIPLDISDADGVELLTANEKNLCSILRILPRLYLSIKETLIAANSKHGYLKRAQARGLVKIDVNKTSRIYDFFVSAGWVKPRLDKNPTEPFADEEVNISDCSALDFSEQTEGPSGPFKQSSEDAAEEECDGKKIPIVKLKLSMSTST